MSEPLLFVDKRECVCCARGASALKRTPIPGEPVVMSATTYLWRRVPGSKGQTKAAPSIRICEECFILARRGSFFGVSKQGKAILNAVLESWARCYSAMTDGEKNVA
jgi:hypothetical protein